jgi:hypothetical protein
MPSDHPISMADLLEGLATTAAALEQHGVSYALIGGMAAGYRSQPRFTKDLDFLLRVPQLILPGLLETLEQQGYQIDEVAAIREWTQHHMVVLSYRGIRVDWLSAVIPAYQHILDRATEETWLGHRIRVASAEGLILMKLLAARTQDWLDIENLIAANRDSLDVDWIGEEWQTLADPTDPRMTRFLELVARAREQGDISTDKKSQNGRDENVPP